MKMRIKFRPWRRFLASRLRDAVLMRPPRERGGAKALASERTPEGAGL